MSVTIVSAILRLSYRLYILVLVSLEAVERCNWLRGGLCSVGAAGSSSTTGRPVVYTNDWAVEVDGGVTVARALAEKHGFQFVTQILPDHYLFRHRHVYKRSVYHNTTHDTLLAQQPQVTSVSQQVVLKRVKRGSGAGGGGEGGGGGGGWGGGAAWMRTTTTALLSDPKWPRMWYLNRGGGLDMNILPAWRRGFTGRGVVVSILDDGIEKDHPDLKKNYNAGASYDVNDHDPDPQPRYDYTNENKHGTRCAGEVAAEANNGICSVGVAYEAGVGGVRMLDGDVTDAVEAQSLSLNPQHIDVYSASWGPDDDGRTVDGPGPLARKAFHHGITFGRRGLGSIFIWASGNGGREGDTCSCDGYTNSIYTLSISSATENGQVPWYSEACSSTLATTYSSGSGQEKQIVTTCLRKSCTETHTGTSASAPLAAGVAALVLQANRQLSWRDLQHIVVLTARQANLEADDWVVNGMGRRVSHHFGFGLLDVTAMVDLALNWSSVPEQHRCEISSKQAARGIPVNGNLEVALESDGCLVSPSQSSSALHRVRYVEHVQAVVTLTASRRGELEIFLTSPTGTRSTLLSRRLRDVSTEGFNGWTFMTTHSWGEGAVGTWRLEVRNGASVVQAKLGGWTLVLYGTEHHPYRPVTSTRTTEEWGRTPPPHPSSLPPLTLATPSRSAPSVSIVKTPGIQLIGAQGVGVEGVGAKGVGVEGLGVHVLPGKSVHVGPCMKPPSSSSSSSSSSSASSPTRSDDSADGDVSELSVDQLTPYHVHDNAIRSNMPDLPVISLLNGLTRQQQRQQQQQQQQQRQQQLYPSSSSSSSSSTPSNQLVDPWPRRKYRPTNDELQPADAYTTINYVSGSISSQSEYVFVISVVTLSNVLYSLSVVVSQFVSS